MSQGGTSAAALVGVAAGAALGGGAVYCCLQRDAASGIAPEEEEVGLIPVIQPAPPRDRDTTAAGATATATPTPAAAADQASGPPPLVDTSSDDTPHCSIVESCGAFASLTLPCRTLLCWGLPSAGGEAPEGCPPLEKLAGTRHGFAALTATTPRSVVVWGDLKVHAERLRNETPANPTRITSTARSVCVENDAGDGVLFGMWGIVRYKGLGIRGLRSTEAADAGYMPGKDSIFAAGDVSSGAQPPHYTQMTDKICATSQAFAAIKQDGTVVAWGCATAGGGAPPTCRDVVAIQSTCQAFAALTGSGEVHAWGNPRKGGVCDAGVAQALSQSPVKELASTLSAFAALNEEGRVVVWGAREYGGDQAQADRALAGKRAQTVKATNFSFAVLCQDGSVVSWGDPELGGTISAAKSSAIANKAVEIFSGPRVFGVILQGSDQGPESRVVVTWGDDTRGGKPPPLQHTANVQTLLIGEYAVVTMKHNGNIITWGDAARGGRVGGGERIEGLTL